MPVIAPDKGRGPEIEVANSDYIVARVSDIPAQAANANLIVKAVNNHEEMVGVLRDIVKYHADDGMRALELLTDYQEQASAILERIGE